MARRDIAPWCDDQVGGRVLELRKKKGLTQKDLSFPGCTAAYVSRIERFARRPSLQIIQAFANRLCVSPEYLAWGKEDSSTRLPSLLAGASPDELNLLEAVLKSYRQLKRESAEL